MAIAQALDFITVKGFKSIASLRLDLRPINVLIGANGSGKSNFISVFSFLHEISEGRLQDYVRRAGGADQVLHFGSKVTREISIHISFEEEKNQYELSLQPTEDDSLYPAVELVYYWVKADYRRPLTRSLPERMVVKFRSWLARLEALGKS